MRKLLILLALTMATTACSMDSTPVASKTAKHICIDEVTYIAFREYNGYRGFGYMSVKLDKDSKVIPCDDNGSRK